MSGASVEGAHTHRLDAQRLAEPDLDTAVPARSTVLLRDERPARLIGDLI